MKQQNAGTVEEKHNMLTWEDIMSAPDVRTEELYIPEWDGWVKLRGLTKRQQQEMRRQAMTPEGMDSDMLEMLMVITGMSEPALTPDTITILREKSSGSIDRILEKILELSGMQPGAADRAAEQFRTGA